MRAGFKRDEQDAGGYVIAFSKPINYLRAKLAVSLVPPLAAIGGAERAAVSLGLRKNT